MYAIRCSLAQPLRGNNHATRLRLSWKSWEKDNIKPLENQIEETLVDAGLDSDCLLAIICVVNWTQNA